MEAQFTTPRNNRAHNAHGASRYQLRSTSTVSPTSSSPSMLELETARGRSFCTGTGGGMSTAGGRGSTTGGASFTPFPFGTSLVVSSGAAGSEVTGRGGGVPGFGTGDGNRKSFCIVPCRRRVGLPVRAEFSPPGVVGVTEPSESSFDCRTAGCVDTRGAGLSVVVRAPVVGGVAVSGR